MSAPSQETPSPNTQQTNRSLGENFLLDKETDVTDENTLNLNQLNCESIDATMIITEEDSEKNFANKKTVQREVKIPDTFIRVEKTDDLEKYIDHLKSASGAEVQIQTVENGIDVSDKMKHILNGYRQIEEERGGTIKKKLIQITFEISIQDKSGISSDAKLDDLESIIKTSGAFIEINKTSKTLIFKIMGHEEEITTAKLAISNIFETSIDLYSNTHLGERYYVQTDKISNSVEKNFSSDESDSWLMNIEK